MNVIDRIQEYFKRSGFVIKRYPFGDRARRITILKHLGIDTLIDVGASKGEYATQMRSLGYQGRIISFEPLTDPFFVLQQRATKDPEWEVYQHALGDENVEMEINIAGNSASSSLLSMLPQHETAAPESAYIGKEKIKVKRLEDLMPDIHNGEDRSYLKIDTQGYEKQVIDGVGKYLDKFSGIQVEMSLVALYAGGILMDEMIRYLAEKGFFLFSLEPGFWDQKTGQLLQVDGIFSRKN